MLGPEEMIAAIPELGGFAEIVPVPFRTIEAIQMTPGIWLELWRLVTDLLSGPHSLDGIVITHGTATLEETAYFLNLTHRSEVPVVLVGSQRPFNATSSDASLNLVNAVRVAGSNAARGLGVLVVMNDEINAAREVAKRDNYRVQAFNSPGLGVLGYVDADRISIYRSPTRRHTVHSPFDMTGIRILPRVDIAVSYAGADGALIDAAQAAGALGIVTAGFPPGFGTPDEVESLRRAADAGVVVVQASRAHSGRVDPRDRIKAAGFVAADNLSAPKARVLLMVALTLTTSRTEIQEMFDLY
jgi:L-asparaginase